MIDDIKQIKDVARALNHLNFQKMDNIYVNLIAIFSERNEALINSAIRLEKIESTEEITGNIILLNFILRDMIENIEILSWLKLKNDNVYHKIGEKEYKEFISKLLGDEKIHPYKFSNNNKNLKYILENLYGSLNLNDDFDKIIVIKKEVHNYIHKNGLKYIAPIESLTYDKVLEKYFNKIKFIFKFYFKIVFLLDNSCIGSSDCIDYLDCGMTPPENCQYWVAPIFDEYIINQFDDNDKNWLKNNNNYNMQFNF